MQPVNDMQPVSFTNCHVCSLSFKSESELQEHFYSVVHHKELQNKHGPNYTHVCNLCHEKCQGLVMFICHLRGRDHCQKVQQQKMQQRTTHNVQSRTNKLVENSAVEAKRKEMQTPPLVKYSPISSVHRTSSNLHQTFAAAKSAIGPSDPKSCVQQMQQLHKKLDDLQTTMKKADLNVDDSRPVKSIHTPVVESQVSGEGSVTDTTSVTSGDSLMPPRLVVFNKKDANLLRQTNLNRNVVELNNNDRHDNAGKVYAKLQNLAEQKRQEALDYGEYTDSNEVTSSTSTNVGGHTKPPVQPNIQKSRSRLVVQQDTSTIETNSSDDGGGGGAKPRRLASLMRKFGNRPAPEKKRVSGPRFGFQLQSNTDNNAAAREERLLLNDALLTIEQLEKNSVTQTDQAQPSETDVNPSLPKSRNHQNDHISNLNSPICSTTTGTGGIMTTNSLNSSHSSDFVSASSNTSHLNAPEVPVASSKDSLSSKLLQMSEEEEQLHVQSRNLQVLIDDLLQETAKVDKVLTDLQSHKQQLVTKEAALKQKSNEIKSQLETIRHERLQILRGSLDKESDFPSRASPVSSPTEPVVESTPINSPSTVMSATPQNRVISETDVKQEMRDYNTFVAQLESSTHIAHDSVASGRDKQVPLVKLETVKNETTSATPDVIPSSCSTVEPQRNTEIEPFPVAPQSTYFENRESPKRPRLVTNTAQDDSSVDASIDHILRRYLDDAAMSNNCREKNVSEPESDTHVSSTSCNVSETEQRLGKHQRKGSSSRKRPRASKSATRFKRKEVPSGNESSMSEPNTSNISEDTLCKNLQPQVPSQDLTFVKLNPTGLEKAARLSRRFDLHSTSVISVHVINRDDIMITCSKDKHICIVNSKTGSSLGSHLLPQVPTTAQIIPADGKQPDKTIVSVFVVFLNDSAEIIPKSTLFCVMIKINHCKSSSSSGELARSRCSFTPYKVLDYESSFLTIHQHGDLLYLGTRDGHVVLFEHKKKLKVREVLDCHSPHAVTCLASGSDGARSILCCGSSDCRISVRDAADGLLLQTFTGHTKTVNCLQMRLNLLYSGASDRTVLVHNVQTGQLLHRFLNMHTGSVKSLSLYSKAIVTMCMDKFVRVLQAEPSRHVSGQPKATSGPPLSFFIHTSTISVDSSSSHSLPLAFVGCQDGKVHVLPLPQLAVRLQLPEPEDTAVTTSFSAVTSGDESSAPLIIDLVHGLKCKWSGCKADGLSNGDALATHLSLFHTTCSYREQLDCCCLWDNCTHYFSSNLDTAEDVRLHMEDHVYDAVKQAGNRR